MVGMLLLGAALLGVTLYHTDLGEVRAMLGRVGVGGILAILVVYAAGFGGVAASWLLTLESAPLGVRWLYRLYLVSLVGDALERATPLGPLGSDPVRAVIVKRRYGVGYTEGTTSLVLTRMTDLFAQVLFIGIGFALMLRAEVLSPVYRIAAGTGLIAFTACIVLFFLAQRLRAYSRLRRWLARRAPRRALWERARRLLDGMGDVEDQLVVFYSERRGRFLGSSTAAFGDWLLSTLAAWLAFQLLGYPISLAEAMIVESFLTLVRSALFFVPADLGTQEGAQVLICGAVTGSPEIGLALAAIRRCRDILWLAAGLALGAHYSGGGPGLLAAAREEQEVLGGS